MTLCPLKFGRHMFVTSKEIPFYSPGATFQEILVNVNKRVWIDFLKKDAIRGDDIKRGEIYF